MRTVARIAGLLAVVAAGLIHSSPASAVEAPWCETGASRFVCTIGTGAAASWTIHYTWGNNTVTVPGTPSYVTGTCRGNTQVRVNYNYYSGGVLVASPADLFLCNPGDWP